MKIIKFFLNKGIIKMVTRERVLRVTRCSVEDFNNHVATWAKYAWLLEYGFDGVDIFIKHFCKEGWCKRELCSIVHTLFHLDEEIFEYGIYWF